jgi:hypothetical protein
MVAARRSKSGLAVAWALSLENDSLHLIYGTELSSRIGLESEKARRNAYITLFGDVGDFSYRLLESPAEVVTGP